MKNKKIVIGVSAVTLAIVVVVICLICTGMFSKNSYLDIDKDGNVFLDPSYVDVKAFSGREHLSKDQISVIKKNAKKMNITPEEYIFLCFMNKNETKNVFKTIKDAQKYQNELEVAYQWSLDEIYDDFVTKSPDWTLIVKAILSQDKIKEIPDEIIIPDKINGIKVKGISSYGFCYTKIKSITIPDCVTSVGNYAFNSCYNLKTINMSKNIVKVGDSAFLNCKNLKQVKSPTAKINWEKVTIDKHNDNLMSIVGKS